MDYDTALSRMAALCSLSEHCESEIRQKLQKAAISVDNSDRIIDKLYEDGYLDTARYCHAYAKDQLRFAHWGRIKIEQALRMKKLPSSDIRKALEELDEEEYKRVLEGVMRQKARTLSDEDEYVRRGKLMRFAAGRGFTPDEIMNYFD